MRATQVTREYSVLAKAVIARPTQSLGLSGRSNCFLKKGKWITRMRG
jgi:hypothetical protein